MVQSPFPTPTPAQAEELQKQAMARIEQAQVQIEKELAFFTAMQKAGGISSIMVVVVRADAQIESRAIVDGRTNPYMLNGAVFAQLGEVSHAIVASTQSKTPPVPVQAPAEPERETVEEMPITDPAQA